MEKCSLIENLREAYRVAMEINDKHDAREIQRMIEFILTNRKEDAK